MNVFKLFSAANVLLLCLSAVSWSAYGNCSRTIAAPVAVLGLSVMEKGNVITGIYPEILRSLSEKEACQFEFSVVPRARLELMFANGQADLLIPAIRTASRDQFGIFTPLIYTRATLISLKSERPVIHTAQELLAQNNLKVVLVRGFDYGKNYQSIMSELNKQGRLFLEPDVISVARMLKAGAADMTIMAPYIFAGTLQTDSRVADLNDKIRYEAIAELPWGDSGAYVSKKSLSAEDRAALLDLLDRAAKSGVVWKGFQQYYAADVINEGNRQREK